MWVAVKPQPPSPPQQQHGLCIDRRGVAFLVGLLQPLLLLLLLLLLHNPLD
jgi:hypothetical protein